MKVTSSTMRAMTASVAVAAVVGIAPVAIASADPATTTTTTTTLEGSKTPITTVVGTGPIADTKINKGDGVWAPSHDESMAIIPVCSGPRTTFKWLYANFYDHGSDLGKFLRSNYQVLLSVITFSANPLTIIEKIFQDVIEVPVYAINDVVFHDPPTIRDILTFCASTRSK